jgi:beta-lactamase superfamily II metal-dependent hydrolase
MAAMTLMVLLWFFVEWQVARQEARITILATESGATIHYRPRGLGAPFLIDPGTSNAVQFVAKPFLRAQGVNRLPTLVLSHGDQNHVGGAEWVTELFRVRQVAVSPLRFRSPAYRRLMQKLEPTPERRAYLSRHDRLGAWRILHPGAEDRFARADDGALVMLGEIYGTRVLLLSDLGVEGQKALLESTPDLRASIVIAGLPAQGEPLGEALLDAIRPQAIVICEATRSAFERARQPLITRLAGRKIPVFYTSTDGSVLLRVTVGKWELRAINGAHAQGVASF